MRPVTSSRARVLEEREIMRVGGLEIIPVDVRIIASTNRSLEELVNKGAFRRDLYYRIKVLEIKAPPLRSRPEDIPLLIDRIARLYAQDNNLPIRRFDKDFKAHLSQAHWSGNVRELRNFVESSIALTSVPVITLDDVSEHLLRDLHNPNTLLVPTEKSTDSVERELIFRTLLELKSDINDIKQFLQEHQIHRALPEDSRMVEVMHTGISQNQTIEKLEQQAIADTLLATNGNRSKAAEILGIGERTLYRKLKMYGIK